MGFLNNQGLERLWAHIMREKDDTKAYAKEQVEAIEDRLVPALPSSVIIPETELEYVNMDDFGLFGYSSPLLANFIHGQTYTVVYNNVPYECIAYDLGLVLEGRANGDFALGNMNALDWGVGNPDAPFIFYSDASYDGYYGFILPIDEVTSVVLSIEGMASSHKQLIINEKGKLAWEEKLAWSEFKTNNIVNIAPTELTKTDGDAAFYLSKPWLEEVIGGKTYIVTYNGTQYACLAESFEIDGISAQVLGNYNIIGMPGNNGNPNAPFILACISNADADGFFGALQTLDSSTSATIAVEGSLETIKKIDKKYLSHNSWEPTFAELEEEIIYSRDNIVLEEIANEHDYTYAIRSEDIGLINLSLDRNKAYTLIADEEEFDVYIDYTPADMDQGNRIEIKCYNENTQHAILAGILINNSASMPLYVISNFNFSSLVIKNPRQIYTKIPSSLVEGTTALTYGDGIGSVRSLNARANGNMSFAFGLNTSVSGSSSVAFGDNASVGGSNSFAFGYGGIVSGHGSFAFGDVDVKDDNQFTIGNGEAVESEEKYTFVAVNERTNIHALAWTGDAYHTGDVYVQGNGNTAGFDGAKKLATEEYVNSKVAASANYFALTDTVTGKLYHITMENGNLVSTLVEGGT